MQRIQKWRVIETACFPNSWKIEAVGCRPDNSTSNFFPSRGAAIQAIEDHGGVVV
jgi:hypothetical protein